MFIRIRIAHRRCGPTRLCNFPTLWMIYMSFSTWWFFFFSLAGQGKATIPKGHWNHSCCGVEEVAWDTFCSRQKGDQHCDNHESCQVSFVNKKIVHFKIFSSCHNSNTVIVITYISHRWMVNSLCCCFCRAQTVQIRLNSSNSWEWFQTMLN